MIEVGDMNSHELTSCPSKVCGAILADFFGVKLAVFFFMGNPKNHALLGTVGKPPLWTQDGFRPVLGTTIDSRIAPGPLFSKRGIPIAQSLVACA